MGIPLVTEYGQTPKLISTDCLVDVGCRDAVIEWARGLNASI
jgi:hypothetical protein